jgi:hypothetical protein
VQVGNAHTITGSGLQSASWEIELDSFNIPLSPQLQIQVTYKNDSLANYYIAYITYPDTIALTATKGWGPFVTNNYTFADTSWHPVPELLNTFKAENLPPRTRKVEFQLLTADSTVIDSLIITAAPGHHIDSAIFPDVRMDELPLSTRYLRVIVYPHGSSDNGLEFHKILSIRPHQPHLISKTASITLTDSIPEYTQKPILGQALMVDSVKHAKITNGPGRKTASRYNGPYSVDVIQGEFSVECWFRLNLTNIYLNQLNEHTFMSVDSVFYIEYATEHEDTTSVLRLYALVDGIGYPLYEAQFSYTLLGNEAWHHFAFTLQGEPDTDAKFYFDGQALYTHVYQENIDNIVQLHPDYVDALRTKPLLLGGIEGDNRTFITAFDEVRFWRSQRSHEQIVENMHKILLQDYFLIGYWNFDDLRNRLNIISDLSRSNNGGELMNGATFIPGNPGIFRVDDSLIIHSSVAEADSVRLAFINQDNLVMDSVTVAVESGKAYWEYDISTLPYTVSQLRVGELYPGSPSRGFETYYNVHGNAPAPIATPRSNWGMYYQSDDDYGTVKNSIVVTGFPENTYRVELGLQQRGRQIERSTYTLNSIPFQYSLNLNGTDNYIQTSIYTYAPNNYDMSLWFKTASSAGGMLIGYCDRQDGIPFMNHDRELFIEKDGSLRFKFIHSGNEVILFGSNKYNDGEWHKVRVRVAPPAITELFVDESLVDHTTYTPTEFYQGYWVIGRNPDSALLNGTALAEYFQGSLSYLNFTENKDVSIKRKYDVNRVLQSGNLLYKFDEGSGNTIHDSQGSNNGTLIGSVQNWTKTNKISAIRWEHVLMNLDEGNYIFYARVFYPGGGEEGVYYPLGLFYLDEALPGYTFSYDFAYGLGYFNEGVELYNRLNFITDFTESGTYQWKENFVGYQVLSPEHYIVEERSYTWTSTNISGSLHMDMGDTPPGSYINLQIGYNTTEDEHVVLRQFSIPLLIRPMLAPVLSGDFGPFDQAIAPGTMKHENTFAIHTEGLSDITKVTAAFYDQAGVEVASADGMQVDDTTWHITQDMSVLSPPESQMKVFYYLGANHFLAKIAGPYKIKIHKTRPGWFDAASDKDFTNIKEYPDSVTFQVTSPFESSYVINNSSNAKIPSGFPLIGGTSASMLMPEASAYLKYIKSENKLILDEPPEFFQKYFNLGAGNPKSFSLKFNYSQNNSYNLDSHNNLFATQNFSMGGSVKAGFQKIDNIVKQVRKLFNFIKDADPESVIVSPTFNLIYTGSFEYSSRLKLTIDSTTGKWGSFGSLDVDANPAHEDDYNKSSSFHFYSGALGLEFCVGISLFEGFASGNFALDGRIDLGFGHSYLTIPSYKDKLLKSLAFQMYGKFYIEVLWGWYRHTLWGPRMFYSHILWGDDMTNCFPPAEKEELVLEQDYNVGEGSGLVRSFQQVGPYSQMPIPKSYSSIHSANNNVWFNWLEIGDSYGIRNLCNQSLDLSALKFSAKKTIESNGHALNSPLCATYEQGPLIHVWAQSRHTSESFNASANPDPIDEFFRSQDIYYSVYHPEADSVFQTEAIEDQKLEINDGRAEGIPKITMLTDSKALITWQVVYPEIPEAEIWYALLEKDGTNWNQVIGGNPFTCEGVETQVKIASPENGKAVLVWLKTSREADPNNTILASYFDEMQWSEPEVVSAPGDQYCNYLDMRFRQGYGALVYTVFVEDTVKGHHEEFKIVPWENDHFNSSNAVHLLTDSVNHMQLPSLAIQADGRIALAIKKEILAPKNNNHICQVDILTGNLDAINEQWEHFEASPLVCDTTKQVSELNLAFAGNDTLILLSQEYPMLGTSSSFQPRHGIIFGDPYMNLVLRSFAVNEETEIIDVDESVFFLEIPEVEAYENSFGLVQCYPNPCADFTFLRFGVIKESEVIIDLYDIRGVLQSHVIELELKPGNYELELNTQMLEKGNYICRLQSKYGTRTIKLVVAGN